VSTVEDHLAVIMVAEMGDVVSGERVCPPETLMREWDLSESDRRALVEWGLPLDSQERPDIQEESGPVLVPNVAGERELRLVSPDQRLYRLINMSVGPVKEWIGAVAGEGRVLMIRPAPVTVNDLAPQLRPYHPGYYSPAVDFVNSSVAQFVEITWRWHAAREVLLALPAPDYGSEAKTREAFDALHT
jgi:hypothetical protein